MLAFGRFFFFQLKYLSPCVCVKNTRPRISAKSTQVHVINYEISSHKDTAQAASMFT